MKTELLETAAVSGVRGPVSPAKRSLVGVLVLIVEDDVDSRDFLELYLKQEGCLVDVAGSAADARAAVQERMPDVILADIILPDEDGLALMSSLRANPSATFRAIALTGYTDSATYEAAIQAGFAKVIGKPVNVFALPSEISAILNRPSDLAAR